MSKDEMISRLLREIESDRFRAVGSADHAGEQSSRTAEWARLNARSYGEIESLYFMSEELYVLSA